MSFWMMYALVGAGYGLGQWPQVREASPAMRGLLQLLQFVWSLLGAVLLWPVLFLAMLYKSAVLLKAQERLVVATSSRRPSVGDA